MLIPAALPLCSAYSSCGRILSSYSFTPPPPNMLQLRLWNCDLINIFHAVEIYKLVFEITPSDLFKFCLLNDVLTPVGERKVGLVLLVYVSIASCV